MRLAPALAATLLAACPTAPVDPPAANWDVALLQTELAVDLADPDAPTAVATLTFDDAASASVDVAGLDVHEVTSEGAPVDFVLTDGRLDVALPSPTVDVSYSLQRADLFEGWMVNGSTVTWPAFCGNVVPCRPHPREASRFGVTVTGTDSVAIAPVDSVLPGPAYQLAFATGPYERTELGVTPGGVSLFHWAPLASVVPANNGTADLLAVMTWLETTLGPYPWGDEAGAVQVDWGPGAIGGMEHHPFWHVSRAAMTRRTVHAHEAAHAWFGDGVRLACWEDLVLSEGLATYLAARAQEAAVSAERGAEVWADYEEELLAILAEPGRDRIVWPETCDEVDVLSDLFDRVLYLRGAFFLRDYAELVGAAALDAALGAFVGARLGTAASFDDLLAHLDEATGVDPRPLAITWLRTLGAPTGFPGSR